MLGWTKWAIAIAIAGLAVGGAAPAIAGDTTVAVQRLGPPDVEARSVGRDGWSALNIATMHYGWDLKRGRPHRVRRALLRHCLFRQGPQRYRSRLRRADARSELQHEAVEPRQDPHLSLRHRDFSGLGYNINFNKATNTLFANLTVHSDILGGDTATNAYHIGFGDPATPANKSAYIDDVHYAAIETPGATSVLRK